MKISRLLKSVAVTATVLVGMAGVIAGCNRGNSGGAKVKKIAFVTNNASPYWTIATNGIKKYEAEAKVQVDIKTPPTGTTAEQNQILNDLVSQGYDAIAVSVITPKDQQQLLNTIATKTKLITVDSDAEKSDRLLYIGSLNYDAGKKLGAEIAKLLPNGGKIAVFVGTFSADNAAQRLKGIEDAVAGKGIEIAEKREDGVDKTKARSLVEDVLNARSDINLVCGLWSYNGSAIAAALEGSSKKGKVLAAVFDDEDGTMKGIESGVIQCTVVQHPFEMGYRSAKWMHQLATDADKAKAAIPASKIDDTGLEVIDKSNVAEYAKRLAEWKK